ncbi:hypothetical protein [Ruminococcus albus]|uniref:Uncharacterized protein n=1 Tax=Ruminococcus albus TaxID=1264 RepID=A0A1I1GUL6_RUMAL|nr:hypothetical protein [Ruminococcus albus]SFC15175.1 hypothetical protein SAMN02910406_01231 [Ruminococcus albus]
MANQKLGVTANELFACNPFRILGLPVTAEDEELTATYKKLLSMGDAENYKTDYDFPTALPPFKRDDITLRTAYAKLASNGYRCFAFSDGCFSQALTEDDVLLNLKDVTCYDAFIRCYMWLITNDRGFEHPHLWILLAKYIDKLIESKQSEWKRLFDNRFPQSVMSAGSDQMLAELHATFKDIILLPLKEMVRGSMRCTSATQILKAAKIDVDKVYPMPNIGQANGSGSKLRIAARDVTGAAPAPKAEEAHTFVAAASAITADAIISEEAPKPAARPVVNTVKPAAPAPAPAQQKPQEEHKVSLVDDAIAAQAASSQNSQSGTASSSSNKTSLVEEEIPVKHVEAIDGLTRPKPIIKKEEPKSTGAFEIPSDKDIASSFTVNAKPDEYTKPKDNMGPVSYRPETDDLPSANVGERTLEAIDPFASVGTSTARVIDEGSIATGTKRKSVNLTGLGDEIVNDNVDDIQFTAPEGYRHVEEEEVVEEREISNRSLTYLINEVDSRTDETTDQLLTEQEIEDELYTDTLIKLLRSNRSSKMMKEVDTEHVYLNGGGTSENKGAEITMDDIDMKKKDNSNLDSAFGYHRFDEAHAAEAIKEKYKNINIGDMLNPTVGNSLKREYHEDPIKEYIKYKKAEKNLSASMMKVFGFVALVGILVFLLIFYL